MALTAGGTCWISPVSAAAAALTRASVSPSAGAPDTTVPSASPVSVAWPSRMVARYSFSVRARWPSRRVAFSTPTTSTPVAMGSSVPAWPTRRVPARRRIRATTSCEVSPEGLSTMTSPLAVVTGPGRALRRRPGRGHREGLGRRLDPPRRRGARPGAGLLIAAPPAGGR